MAEYEDDTEFNAEEVQKLAEEVVNNVVGGEELTYQRDKVNQWC